MTFSFHVFSLVKKDIYFYESLCQLDLLYICADAAQQEIAPNFQGSNFQSHAVILWDIFDFKKSMTSFFKDKISKVQIHSIM